MDLGWNKSGQQAQNNQTNSTPSAASTSATVTTPATAPASTPGSAWDLPGTKDGLDTRSDATVNEKNLDFSTNSRDDSFDEDSTSETPPADSKAENDAVVTQDTDFETASPYKTENEVIAQDKPEVEKVKEVEEKAEPVEEDIPATNLSNTGKSLSELEKDISNKKDSADKELAVIQDKIKKFDDLLARIGKMKDEESSLIKEISSTL